MGEVAWAAPKCPTTAFMESRARRELTLITCYPFYFVGAAPQRFIVHARPLN